MAKAGAARKEERQVVATNRRARHDFEIGETLEAGLALVGPEVKSLRAGRASLGDAFVTVRRGEAWLVNCHVSPYTQAGRENPEPRRDRKLLLHRREIARLRSKAAERGITLVPLALYFRNGRAKVEVAVARGRRKHDKREAIKRREQEREMERAVRGPRRSGR